MELKKVNEVVSKGYAKKDEISKKELRKFNPTKWLTASAAGLVTLLYSSPKNSIHKIGVVFGCIQIAEPGYDYTSSWYIINSIMDVYYYISWVLGVALLFLFGNHMINKKKYDEDKRLKSIKRIKILAMFFIVCIVITALLVCYLVGIKDIAYNIMVVFHYISLILGVALLFLLGNHMINRKKYDEDKRLKYIRRIKILTIILIICIISIVLLDGYLVRTQTRGVLTDSVNIIY